MRLVLASGSPRRAELLAAAGFEFEIVRADVDERVMPQEAAPEYVLRLAREKSARGFEMLSRCENASTATSVVIGADTAVVVDGAILGKPGDDDEAEAMLVRLSGRSHEVMTGISLRSGSDEVGHVATTVVWFTPLTREELLWYVSTGEGRDKAGAYAIQGRGARFIPRINGSYSNVVGLPVAAVSEMLRRFEEKPSSWRAVL